MAPGVGDEEQPGLPEGGLDLVGEGAGGEAAGDGGAADVPGLEVTYRQLEEGKYLEKFGGFSYKFSFKCRSDGIS